MIEEFEQDVIQAVAALRSGGIILYPTDTIWGIGCDAKDENAVQKIYKLKQRAASKALIVLVAQKEEAEKWVEIPPLMSWEPESRPTTYILPVKKGLAPGAVAKDNTIAVRIPQDAFCQALLSEFGEPIISTSANISGTYFPGSYKDISPAILSGVDYIVKYRQSEYIAVNPSKIIKVEPNGEQVIIRP